MGGLAWWHWVIIIAALVLIFGAKKLPDAARGLGRSMRILKSEVNAMHDDDAHGGDAPGTAGGSMNATAPGTPAIAPAAPAMTTPMAAPVAAPAPVPAPAAVSQPAQPAAVQATTIDGKPAVIINGVPTLIDNQAT